MFDKLQFLLRFSGLRNSGWRGTIVSSGPGFVRLPAWRALRLAAIAAAMAFNAEAATVGDNLDIHHVGQSHPMSQVIPGYNPNTAPAIAIPQPMHQQIPTLSGPYTGTARDLLAKDIRDLRNYTDAPNSSLQELIWLNKQMYPGAYRKP